MSSLATGWEVILIGMGTVLAALVILGLVIILLRKLLGPSLSPETLKKNENHEIGEEENSLNPPIAVIAAAIQAYQEDQEFSIVRIKHRGQEWVRDGRQQIVKNKPERKGSSRIK